MMVDLSIFEKKPLTQERKLTLGADMADAVRQKERLQDHLKEWMKETKEAIKYQEKRISQAAEAISQGFEMISQKEKP
jgi:F0F1-type ATP synthase membrane subunit b/b'